jgi:ubiquitin-conjugating enzyme E2 S
LLIVPFPESSLNDEAGKLFMESYDEFARRARIMTQVHALPDPAAGSGAAEAGLSTGAGLTCSEKDSEEGELEKQKQKAIKDAKKKSLKRL